MDHKLTTTFERNFVRRLLRILRERYPGVWNKNHQGAFSGAGRADIEGCYKGKYIAIECKAPGRYSAPEKGLSPLQKQYLENVAQAGGHALVADSVESVVAFMEAIKNET